MRRLVIFAVALIAIAVNFCPCHNELDWEGTLIPAARQRFSSSSSSEKAMEGKVVLITGATSGIGLALTQAISHQLGATVLALGRNPQKLQKLQQEIPSVQTFQADFSDLSSVSRVSDEILAKANSSFHKIDVLINNAGMFMPLLDSFNSEAMTTPQGLDTVFTVNYLSGFLLTEKLSPLLASSSAPTIVQVSSGCHFVVDGSDLTIVDGNSSPVASRPGGRPGFDVIRPMRSYANSKLAQIFHARSLRKQHPLLSSGDKNVRTASICPTWVGTNIGGEGIFAQVLATLGFPVDGWGIASALTAMVSDEQQEQNKDDYYSNLGGVDFSNTARMTTFLSRFGVREYLFPLSAYGTLFTQRFLTGNKVTLASSSTESYNEGWAKDLYDWSLKTVQPYL